MPSGRPVLTAHPRCLMRTCCTSCLRGDRCQHPGERSNADSSPLTCTCLPLRLRTDLPPDDAARPGGTHRSSREGPGVDDADCQRAQHGVCIRRPVCLRRADGVHAAASPGEKRRSFACGAGIGGLKEASGRVGLVVSGRLADVIHGVSLLSLAACPHPRLFPALPPVRRSSRGPSAFVRA